MRYYTEPIKVGISFVMFSPSNFKALRHLNRRALMIAIAVIGLTAPLSDTGHGSEFLYQTTPGPEDLAFARGVSGDGSAAAGLIVGALTGYIWTEEGGFETIDPLPDFTFNRLYGVSSDGSTFTGAATLESDGLSHQYVWSRENGYVLLPELEAERAFRGVVTDDGSEIYGSSVHGDRRRYWRWNAADGYEFIPQLETAYLGSTSFQVDPSLGTTRMLVGKRLFLQRGAVDLDSDIRFILPQPSDAISSTVRDASTDGSLAVGRIAVNDDEFQAMRWTVDSGEVETLGVLDYPNHYRSDANGVSADGKVVIGLSYAPQPEPDTRAFVWDERNGMRELEAVFRDEYGLEVHPWGVSNAIGISDDRRTIVGHIRQGRKAAGSPGDMWVAKLDWPLGSIRGDFDLDDVLDANDADILITAILENSSDPLFDLDENGLTAPEDLTDLLRRAERSVGDTNFDGKVDFADFLELSTNFGRAGLWSQGDFDANGKIEFADFLGLSSNFGETAALISVPEPTLHPLSLALFLLVAGRLNVRFRTARGRA